MSPALPQLPSPPRAAGGTLARPASAVAAALVFVLGVAGFVGHPAERPALMALASDLPPMPTNTALAFVLFGTGLLAARSGARLVGSACGSLVAALGSVTLLEYLGPFELGIDGLFSLPSADEIPAGNRPAPGTAIALSLLGLALLALALPLGQRLRIGLALGAAAIAAPLGAMALFGYAAGYRSAYAWGPLAPIALSTAIGLLLAATGLATTAALVLPGSYPTCRRCLPWLAALATLCATGVLWQALANEAAARQRAGTTATAEAAAAQLIEHTELIVRALERLAHRTAAVAFENPSAWRDDASLYLAHEPALAALVWTDASDSRRWVLRAGGGNPLPGLPLLPDPALRAAFAAARQSGQPVVGAITELDFGRFGCVAALPSHRAGTTTGFIGGLIDLATLLHPIAAQAGFRGYVVSLHAGGRTVPGTGGGFPPGDGHAGATVTWRGQRWTVVAAPRVAPSPVGGSVPLLVFGLGVTIAGALAASIHATHEAARKNAALEALNRDLGREIAERTRIDLRLRESEERFRQAFDSAAIGFALVGLDGRWLRVNRALCRLLGYSAAQLMEKTFQDITHPDDLDADLGHVRRLLDGQQTHYQMEKRYLHAAGHVIWIRLSASLVRRADSSPVHFVSQIEDITARRLADKARRDSEERFRQLANLAPIGIYLTDPAGRCVYTNPKWRQLAGLDAAAAEGEGWAAAIHPDDRDAVVTAWQEAAAHRRTFAHTFRFVTPAGAVHWVHSRAVAVLGSDGSIAGHIGANEDITSLKELQARLEERNAELLRETQRAQEASRLKSRFLATMSHEFRTPLNGIIGFSTFLASGRPGPLNPRQQEYLGDALASARHLLRLINDLLDLAKIEAGRTELAPETFRLRDVVEEVAAGLAPLVAAKRLRCTAACTAADDAVRLDPRRIRQVLYNLLSNAIKFTPPDGAVAVTLGDGPDGDLCLRVSDTGVGIAAADLPRLFVEFEQLGTRTDETHAGTGLGLALTKRLVELHGGAIAVASTPGAGTTFTVRLPRHPDFSPA